jgi:hypothetical protein
MVQLFAVLMGHTPGTTPHADEGRQDAEQDMQQGRLIVVTGRIRGKRPSYLAVHLFINLCTPAPGLATAVSASAIAVSCAFETTNQHQMC